MNDQPSDSDAARDDVTVAALAPLLEREVPGFHGLRAVRKFNTGQSNPTYRLDADSGTLVLRAKPPGQLLKSAHQVDREYRVMAALRDSAVPVPEIYFLSPDDESPIGRMFFVMAHVDGRIFWDPALPECDTAERAALYDAMNQTLAALHDVDPDAVGLSDFGRPGNYFARQLGRWSQQYDASEVEPIAAMRALIDWLEKNLPADDGAAALVHGDFRLDNMIFAPDQPRVAALLDWELSTLGHPLADLAYQCMQLRLPNDGLFKGLGGVDRAALGLPSEQDYVADYCRRRGLDPRIDHWTFYLAFNFFRLGAILQGVYKRSLDGNASNPERARKLGAAVPVLAEQAMRLVDSDGV